LFGKAIVIVVASEEGDEESIRKWKSGRRQLQVRSFMIYNLHHN
jgi:hypothetical protein